jgi:hypothetical protein
MFILDGKPLAPDVAFTHKGIQYPANWLRLSSQLDRERVGITEVPDAPTWDQRFYWGYDQDGDLIPKDHGQLVEQWTTQTRTTAGTLLMPTDWQVIRQSDNGVEMSASVKELREEIRLAAGAKNAAITATTDTAELAAYITGPIYPTWPPYADPDSVDAAGDSVSDRVEPSQYGSSDGLIG